MKSPLIHPLATVAAIAAAFAGCDARDVVTGAAADGRVEDAGAAADDGGGDAGGAQIPERSGCADGIVLYETPPDAAARGPWPVGVATAKVDTFKIEVWYPAVVGSEKGAAPENYDLRLWLPPLEKKKIPDGAAPLQTCGCFRDLPIDAAHGPYPVVVFIHGTAGFRTQSLQQMEHWASRGFVVVAADHPGLRLADMLSLEMARDLAGDTEKILLALEPASGDLGFLAGRMDLSRVAMSGHSAGGGAVGGFGAMAGVRMIIPLAAGGATPSPTLESTLVMGGEKDKVVPYENQQKGYEDSAPLKRLVGVGNTGHLFPTDLCWMRNDEGEDVVTVALKYEISNAEFASSLFDCPEGQLDRDTERNIVNFATTAALEETLACKPGDPFEGIQVRFPDIVEFREGRAR